MPASGKVERPEIRFALLRPVSTLGRGRANRAKACEEIGRGPQRVTAGRGYANEAPRSSRTFSSLCSKSALNGAWNGATFSAARVATKPSPSGCVS